ncbi:hypothetical protein GCM10027203_29400 [Nonomuraea fastidiosa]
MATDTLRGIATLTFWAADLEAAQSWYTEFLGIEPYYHRPGYVEFRLGDYQHEFGIIDTRYAHLAPQGPARPTGPRAPSRTGTWTIWRPRWSGC